MVEWHLVDTKPLFEPMLEYCYLTNKNTFQWNVNRNSCIAIQENEYENAVCQNGVSTLFRSQSVSDMVTSGGVWLMHPPGCEVCQVLSITVLEREEKISHIWCVGAFNSVTIWIFFWTSLQSRYIGRLMQDCSNPSALAVESLQSYA